MANEFKYHEMRSPLLESQDLNIPLPGKWRKIFWRATFAMAWVMTVLAFIFNRTNIISGVVTQFMLSISLLMFGIALINRQFLANSQKSTNIQLKVYSKEFEKFYQKTASALVIAITFASLAATTVLVGIYFPTAGKPLTWILSGTIISLLIILLYTAYLHQHRKEINNSLHGSKLKTYFFTSGKNKALFFSFLILGIASLLGLHFSGLGDKTWLGIHLATMLNTIFIAAIVFAVLRQLASFSIALRPRGKLDECIETLCQNHPHSPDFCQALRNIQRLAQNHPWPEQFLNLCSLLETLPNVDETKRLQIAQWLGNSHYLSRPNLSYAGEILRDTSSLHKNPEIFIHLVPHLESIYKLLDSTQKLSFSNNKQSFFKLLFEHPTYIKQFLNGLRINARLKDEPLILPKTRDDMARFEGRQALKAAGLWELRASFETLQNEEVIRHVGSILAFFEGKQLLNPESYQTIRSCALSTPTQNLPHILHILEILKESKLATERNCQAVIQHAVYAAELASVLDNMLPIYAAYNRPSTQWSEPLIPLANETFQKLIGIIQKKRETSKDTSIIFNTLNSILQKIKNTSFFSQNNDHNCIIKKHLTDMLLDNPDLILFFNPIDFIIEDLYPAPNDYLPIFATMRMQSCQTILFLLKMDQENYAKLTTIFRTNVQKLYQLRDIADIILNQENVFNPEIQAITFQIIMDYDGLAELKETDILALLKAVDDCSKTITTVKENLNHTIPIDILQTIIAPFVAIECPQLQRALQNSLPVEAAATADTKLTHEEKQAITQRNASEIFSANVTVQHDAPILIGSGESKRSSLPSQPQQLPILADIQRRITSKPATTTPSGQTDFFNPATALTAVNRQQPQTLGFS